MCKPAWKVTLVVSDSLRPCGLYPARLLCPWDSPGQNTGVGCHALFQGIFLTHGLNPCLLHCRWTFYHLSHQGSTTEVFFFLFSEVLILSKCTCIGSRGKSLPRVPYLVSPFIRDTAGCLKDALVQTLPLPWRIHHAGSSQSTD